MAAVPLLEVVVKQQSDAAADKTAALSFLLCFQNTLHKSVRDIPAPGTTLTREKSFRYCCRHSRDCFNSLHFKDFQL